MNAVIINNSTFNIQVTASCGDDLTLTNITNPIFIGKKNNSDLTLSSECDEKKYLIVEIWFENTNGKSNSKIVYDIEKNIITSKLLNSFDISIKKDNDYIITVTNNTNLFWLFYIVIFFLLILIGIIIFLYFIITKNNNYTNYNNKDLPFLI